MAEAQEVVVRSGRGLILDGDLVLMRKTQRPHVLDSWETVTLKVDAYGNNRGSQGAA